MVDKKYKYKWCAYQHLALSESDIFLCIKDANDSMKLNHFDGSPEKVETDNFRSFSPWNTFSGACCGTELAEVDGREI